MNRAIKKVIAREIIDSRGNPTVEVDVVLEDVVDILLNLKGVVFKLEGRDEVTVMLRKDGEGIVTAGDFKGKYDTAAAG